MDAHKLQPIRHLRCVPSDREMYLGLESIGLYAPFCFTLLLHMSELSLLRKLDVADLVVPIPGNTDDSID